MALSITRKPNARTYGRLPLRPSPIPPHRRAGGFQALLVQRLSAPRWKRDSQCDLCIRGHCDRRRTCRVHERGRKRKPCTKALLRQVRQPPFRGQHGKTWIHSGSARDTRRSVVDHPASEYLGVKCARLGMPQLAATSVREAATSNPGACECGLTPRSSRAPTARRQGPAAGTRYIVCVRALAPSRRVRLSSNVRPHARHLS